MEKKIIIGFSRELDYNIKPPAVRLAIEAEEIVKGIQDKTGLPYATIVNRIIEQSADIIELVEN